MLTLHDTMDLTLEAYSRVKEITHAIASANGITGYDELRLTIIAAVEASRTLRGQYSPKVDWDTVRACLNYNASLLRADSAADLAAADSAAATEDRADSAADLAAADSAAAAEDRADSAHIDAITRALIWDF